MNANANNRRHGKKDSSQKILNERQSKDVATLVIMYTNTRRINGRKTQINHKANREESNDWDGEIPRTRFFGSISKLFCNYEEKQDSSLCSFK